MDRHLAPVGAAIADVAVHERWPLRRDTEQLADQRIGLAVTVTVDREQCLGDQIVCGGSEQVDQAVDRGAGRAGDARVVLERQDHARTRRDQDLAEVLAEHLDIRRGITRQPGVRVADDTAVLHDRRQNGFRVLPPCGDRAPTRLVENRVDRHDLDRPIQRRDILKPRFGCQDVAGERPPGVERVDAGEVDHHGRCACAGAGPAPQEHLGELHGRGQQRRGSQVELGHMAPVADDVQRCDRGFSTLLDVADRLDLAAPPVLEVVGFVGVRVDRDVQVFGRPRLVDDDVAQPFVVLADELDVRRAVVVGDLLAVPRFRDLDPVRGLHLLVPQPDQRFLDRTMLVRESADVQPLLDLGELAGGEHRGGHEIARSYRCGRRTPTRAFSCEWNTVIVATVPGWIGFEKPWP
nr:hypothetical protein [Mycolicibacterium peregrinum]